MPSKRINSKSIKVDGTDDHVLVPDQDLFSFGDGSGNDKPFTFSAWVFVEDVTGGDEGPFITKGEVGGGTTIEYIFKHKEGQLRAFIYRGDNTGTNNRIRLQADAATIPDATWTHVALTYDGSLSENGLKFYTNGSATAATAAKDGDYAGGGGTRNSAQPLIIGKTNNAGANAAQTFEDFIADVCIFNKELSLSEIQEIYNSGKVKDMTKASTYNNLISWWKMGDDEDHNSTGGIKDYVNGFNGTLTNGAYIAASPELGTDLIKIADHHIYTSQGRTRQITNAAGAFGSAIATPTAAPTLASDGYDTQNQRFAHIVINTFPINVDNNSSFIVHGYNHAFGKWAVLRRHASGFKNIYVNGGTDDFRLQHSQNTRPCTRYVLEIAGIDRIYIQADAGAANAATDQVFLGFNTF